jgi:predicted O-methyltransferase YrrM
MVGRPVSSAVVLFAVAGLLFLCVPAGHALQDSKAGVPPTVLTVLQQIKAADKDLMAISEEDGRFLRAMVVTRNATRAIEIGTADGYSAIWIGLGLRETGGRLTTFEYDPARARGAAVNIQRAGLAEIVTVVPGDAFQQIPKITGTVDFVFLDAWKKDYKRFFDLLMPRLEARGLFLGHNVVNKQSEMGDFLQAILHDPRLVTSIVKPGDEGMSVSVKIRR